MTKEDVNRFNVAKSQLNDLYKEIGVLSKKNPNDAVNKFKLKFINQSLKESNELLGEAYKPYKDFDIFNEDELPTTSDVVMILDLYLSALNRFEAGNTEERDSQSEWGIGKQSYWVIDGKVSDITA
jgi:hypothetical protein